MDGLFNHFGFGTAFYLGANSFLCCVPFQPAHGRGCKLSCLLIDFCWNMGQEIVSSWIDLENVAGVDYMWFVEQAIYHNACYIFWRLNFISFKNSGNICHICVGLYLCQIVSPFEIVIWCISSCRKRVILSVV